MVGARRLASRGYPEYMFEPTKGHADYLGVDLDGHIGFVVATLREESGAPGFVPRSVGQALRSCCATRANGVSSLLG